MDYTDARGRLPFGMQQFNANANANENADTAEKHSENEPQSSFWLFSEYTYPCTCTCTCSINCIIYLTENVTLELNCIAFNHIIYKRIGLRTLSLRLRQFNCCFRVFGKNFIFISHIWKFGNFVNTVDLIREIEKILSTPTFETLLRR